MPTPFLAAVLDRLIDELGTSEASDMAAARDAFYQRRGRVHEDEELFEPWTQAFLEWYAVERPGADGEAPVLRAWRRETDDRSRDALAAWLRSQRVLGEIIEIGEGEVRIHDQLGGARFAVQEKRSLHGVAAGDLAEMRLVGFEGHVVFGRTFCYHPPGTRTALLGQVERMRGSGANDAEILDFAASLRVRCERYAHVPPLKIYASATAS